MEAIQNGALVYHFLRSLFLVVSQAMIMKLRLLLLLLCFEEPLEIAEPLLREVKISEFVH